MEKSLNKFSVIVPCYNSFHKMEKFFKCFEHQSFKEFEIIIIDDKSVDGTYEEILKYAKNTSINLRVVQNDVNSGPGFSRNRGIDLAQGEWITFVDCDDYVSENLLYEINEVIENNEVNCVVFDYQTVKKDEVVSMKSLYGNHQTGIIDISECLSYIRNHTHCKCYKRKCIKKKSIYFPNLKRCEDIAFVGQAVVACEKIYYLNKPLYYYVQWEQSLSKNESMGADDLITAFEILENAIGEKYVQAIQNQSVSTLLYGGTLIMCKNKISKLEVKKFIENYKSKYPNWKDYSINGQLGRAKSIFLFLIDLEAVSLLKIMAYIHTKMVV